MRQTTVQPKRMPKPIFAELKTALQSDETQNVRVGIATDNRMNYQTDREEPARKVQPILHRYSRSQYLYRLRVQPSRGSEGIVGSIERIELVALMLRRTEYAKEKVV